MSWVEMRKLVSGWIGFIGNYINFIMTIRPDLKDNALLVELRKLEKNIANASGPFLTYEESIKKQNKIYPLLLNWNNEIAKQASEFYNLTAEIARLTAKPNSSKSSFKPFKMIDQNSEKFLLAASLVTGVFYSVKEKPDAMELLAMFYGLIATSQTTYHYIFEQINEAIDHYGLNDKYDIYKIFSIKSKIKDRKNEDQTDIRAIRNALSHFDFKLIKNKKSTPSIVLRFGPSNKEKILTFEEFKNFYFNSVFLLHTFLAILYWHAAFATIRANFVKKKNCPICKKGVLKIGYTAEIYETRVDPTLCMFWSCNSCNSNIPYNNQNVNN